MLKSADVLTKNDNLCSIFKHTSAMKPFKFLWFKTIKVVWEELNDKIFELLIENIL